MNNSGKYIKTASLLFFILLAVSSFSPAFSQGCDENGNLLPGNGEDLEITTTCMVGEGTYHYGYVNIYNGGELIFDDAHIDFWASSILIENNSALIAENIGVNGLLTIHLYGEDMGASGDMGITCKTDSTCGVDTVVWNSNGENPVNLPGGVNDRFYAYENLPYYVNGVNSPNNQGFFGHKVLAVSYGGTLILHGVKGSSTGDLDPSDSGTSWARLNGTINSTNNSLTLDRAVDWKQGDQIVVTTTDYLPGNSEQREITSISADGRTITVDSNFKHIHNGEKYQIKTADRITDGIDRLGLKFDEAETRAAVALLTRSIRIVSEGSSFNEKLPFNGSPDDYYGGHTIFRQGFKQIQVQGVEFYQMGQGGRIGRYPVNFMLARKTPSDTYLKDNSIHDSMTRWITLQGTHGVLLERNVGYKSIGHGYFLKDATEIDNKFYSNIGILALAAIDNVQNSRKVPGIYASSQNPGIENVPFHSDFQHPTVFWISNGWNDFKYNMAAGATTCGTCYWFVPGANSTQSRNQQWDSYASVQVDFGNAGTTPLMKFKGNYCTTAMNSFNTVGDVARCLGVGDSPNGNDVFFAHVENKEAPNVGEDYYPRVAGSASRIATRCTPDAKNADGTNVGPGLDCSKVARCAENNANTNCNVTTLEEFTTSFHFTETNFSAIWLRPQWFYVVNSFISDVQNAGLTFVTGGDYTRSSSIGGNWLVASKNVFVGNTQENNPFASHAGPVVPGGLKCNTMNTTANYCLLENEGLSFPLSNFANNQRLFNIYDGPAQQADNAYLDITTTKIPESQCKLNAGNCQNSDYMYGKVLGMPFDRIENSCILPNAAIAWKQPNGFYYPPSFHSENLFFDNVNIRHFIINPLFLPGTRTTNFEQVQKQYCTHAGPGTFNDFTEVDRQTVLNDDDGSLTGYQRSISVNEDPFFNAPIEAIECESLETAKTSPYEYVTTAVFPACGSLPLPPGCNDEKSCETCTDWDAAATDPTTYGVPIYRQCVTATESDMGESPSIRLMGQSIHQRSNLLPNNAIFYIDTTVSIETQKKNPRITRVNVFRPNETYYVYHVYATDKTNQEYQLYVGEGVENFELTNVKAVRTPLLQKTLQFNDLKDTNGNDLWPETWSRTYDSNTGILRVKMNMNFDEFRNGLIEEKKKSCRPASFCSLDNTETKCECSETLKKEDPDLYNLCKEDNVCRWAGVDVDCPAGGCYGFSFTLPSGFSTKDCNETPGSADQCGRLIADGGNRPDVMCFPAEDGRGWKIPWIKAVKDSKNRSVAGKCELSPVFDNNFCDLRGGQPKIACNLIEGTHGDDYISGTSESDVIRGLGGDDLIFGLEGNDFIQGGPGDDLIFGGRDNDTIQGGSGDDNLDGHTGNDTIDGGEGFDIVDGGSDSDTCENHEDSFDCEIQN